MPNCVLCYGVKFNNWVEYHDHYEEHHLGNTWQVDDKFDIIKRKAFATPLNISGRTKKQIVEFCEENYLKEYLIY